MINHFCEKFINLYKDIYVNKSKFHLIEDKINYHTKQNIPGGICDMTLYYLLQSEEILDTQNLFFPIKDRSGSEFIFMNNFSNSEGPNGKNSFKFEKGQISIINRSKIFDTVNKKKYNLCNIHFQGGAKKRNSIDCLNTKFHIDFLIKYFLKNRIYFVNIQFNIICII